MSWIDDDLKKRGEIEARNQLIGAHAELVYNNLWEAIAEGVTEAKSKGIPVYTNGSPYERLVLLSVMPNPNQRAASPKELKVIFRKESSTVAISNQSGLYSFNIAVCQDDVVCLRLGDKPISIHDAAIHVLRPFLFPDVVSAEYNKGTT